MIVYERENKRTERKFVGYNFFFRLQMFTTMHQVSARTNSCCSKKAKLFSPQLDRHVLGKGGDKTSKKTTIFLSIYFHRLDNKIA